MNRYGIIAPLVLLGSLMTANAQASGSRVDIELGCVAVANEDISIKTGDCRTRRVETVKVVKIVEEERYRGHPVHVRHPGKAKGHHKKNKKYVEVVTYER